jgi:glycosyltransferase involved in cell wall biosynthesis
MAPCAGTGSIEGVPDVILPVLDEAAAIPWVLERMPPDCDPIVVDNGSTDGSGDIARRLGARVVEEPAPGFGAACFAGLAAAGDDLVCFMDCDGSLDPGDLWLVLAPVAASTADLVLGARQGTRQPHTRVANAVVTRALRRRTGLALRDLGPMRAARREALLGLGIADRRFGWPLEMVMRAAAAGWRVTEVDVRHGPREGRSKVTGTVRGTLRATRDMTRLLAAIDPMTPSPTNEQA